MSGGSCYASGTAANLKLPRSFTRPEGTQFQPFPWGRSRRLKSRTIPVRVVITFASFTRDTVLRGDTKGTTVSDIVEANRTSLSNNIIVDTEEIIPTTSAPETIVQSQEAFQLATAVEVIPAQAELQLSSSSAQLHSSSAPAQLTITTLASGNTTTFGNSRTNIVIGIVTLFAFGLGVVMAQLIKPQRSRNRKRNNTSERLKRMTRVDDTQQIKPKKKRDASTSKRSQFDPPSPP